MHLPKGVASARGVRISNAHISVKNAIWDPFLIADYSQSHVGFPIFIVTGTSAPGAPIHTRIKSQPKLLMKRRLIFSNPQKARGPRPCTAVVSFTGSCSHYCISVIGPKVPDRFSKSWNSASLCRRQPYAIMATLASS
jgi:hypothetical protein